MCLQEFLYYEVGCKQRGYTRLAEIGDSGYSVNGMGKKDKIRKHQSNKV